MKTLVTLLVAFLITLSGFSQQGINYKAILKDTNGNILANTFMNVQFTIHEETAIGSIIYQEDHNYTTDANGMLILNIGTDTTPSVGTFVAIDWATDLHFLQVSIIYSGGTIDFDATQFRAVPYALSSADSITKIDDLTDGKSDSDGTQNGSSVYLGHQAGYFDDGTDNNNTGIGFNALWGNTNGGFDTAVGYQALSSNSTGSSNTAIGYQSLTSNATGFANTASGSQSLFINTTGAWNTAIGIQSLQNNQDGSFNTATGLLSLRQNISGSFNTGAGGQALLDNTSGNYNTSMGYGSGERVEGSNNTFLGYRAGSGTAGSTRSISGSVFLGYQAGYNEIFSNRLYIDNSSTTSPLIFGDFGLNFIRINGYQSILTSSGNSLRLESTSSNNYITFTNSAGYKGYSGIFNGTNDMDFGTGGGNTTGKVHLVIGASPKLTVDADGDVGIGTENPTRDLDVVGSGRFTGDLNVGNNLWIGNYAYLNSAYINLVSRLSIGTNVVPSAENSYSLGLSNRRWMAVWANDGTINTSDRRDKTNIASLNYGLEEVMKLQPVSFNWKNNSSTDKKLGLIAQDLLQVIPEVVKTHEIVKINETGKTERRDVDRLGVYYSDLIPVLIKALQEQQTIIDAQNEKIEAQAIENTQQNANIDALLQRMNALEVVTNQ